MYRGTSLTNRPPSDPTVGLCLRPYGGPRGEAVSYERGTPVGAACEDVVQEGAFCPIEQWLQRHPEAGSSWPSWPGVTSACLHWAAGPLCQHPLEVLLRHSPGWGSCMAAVLLVLKISLTQRLLALRAFPGISIMR